MDYLDFACLFFIISFLAFFGWWHERSLRKQVESHADYWHNEYRKKNKEYWKLLKERKQIYNILNSGEKECPVCKAENCIYNDYCISCKCQF